MAKPALSVAKRMMLIGADGGGREIAPGIYKPRDEHYALVEHNLDNPWVNEIASPVKTTKLTTDKTDKEESTDGA